MLTTGFVLRRISPPAVLLALFFEGTALFCQAPAGPSESAPRPGSTQQYPIAIEYKEVLAHRLGDTPILRVSERQASQWRYDDFEYQVTVSPAGEVTDAKLTSNPPSDMPPALTAQAGQLVRAIHFKPFEREGRPVWATVVQYVLVLPPEKMPSIHVPFPAYEGKTSERKSLLITLERTGCYGACPSYVLRIHGDGRVEFDGRMFVAARGRQTTTISLATVDALIDDFRKADFFSLSGEYRYSVTDNPTYIVCISIGGQKKQVIDYVGEQIGMPAVVTRLEETIDKAADSERWIHGDPAKTTGSPVE